MKRYYVYILASKKNGVLYIGVTGNLPNRIKAHKEHAVPGFTDKYFVHKLVYLEVFDTAYNAINRGKQLKKWKREWKIQAIESMNPDWEDLSEKKDFIIS